MKQYKVKKVNYYGFDEKEVNKKFSGGLIYLNTFCVNDEYHPTAVYKVKSPDKSKGHKKYLLLNGSPLNIVRGMTSSEIKKWRYQNALWCLTCNTVIYSMYRHDYQTCNCKANAVSIDGGSIYTKIGYNNFSTYVQVVLDLLTDKIIGKKP